MPMPTPPPLPLSNTIFADFASPPPHRHPLPPPLPPSNSVALPMPPQMHTGRRHLLTPSPLSTTTAITIVQHQLGCRRPLHCRDLPPPLLNAIFVTVFSPPPCRCPSPPPSNAIVILHCNHYCCGPLPPSNANTHRCPLLPSKADACCHHPLLLVSNAIFTSPPPCCSPSPSLSNTVKCCHHY
jgi:hypothetical protein